MTAPLTCRCQRHLPIVDVDGARCHKSGLPLFPTMPFEAWDQRTEIELVRDERRREREAETYRIVGQVAA